MSPRLLFLLSALRAHRTLRLDHDHDHDLIEAQLAAVRTSLVRRRRVTLAHPIESRTDDQPWLIDTIFAARDLAETTRLIAASR